MKPKLLTETAIQRQILDYLKAKDVFHFRCNTTGIMRKGRWCPSPTVTKGTCDIVAIKTNEIMVMRSFFDMQQVSAGKQGIFVGIEVKRPGGKLSPDQKAFLSGVEKAGGLAIVAYSVEDVKKVFG